MVRILQISIIACMLCLLAAIFGNASYPILSRICFSGLALLFWLLARGIEKGKLYGWWAGTGILCVIGVSVPLEIVSAVLVENSVFEILKRVFPAIFVGTVLALIFIKFWKPKIDFFNSKGVSNTEQVAGGDATR